MCQALGDFSMHLISFNSYNYPAEHMFCSLTVKSLLSHAFTHLFSNYFVGAMCHALNKKLDPVLIGKDKRKRRKPSIKEIITAWDKSPGDPADWVVRKGDVWVETCRTGMGHLRALHLLCPPLAMLLLLSRRIATWGSEPRPRFSLCDPGQATFLLWASVSSSVNWGIELKSQRAPKVQQLKYSKFSPLPSQK